MKNFILLFLFSTSMFFYAQHNVSTFNIEAKTLNCNKKIWIYLPEDYAASSKKYPVIYMHDAQNLFDTKTSYAGEWQIDEILDCLKAKVIVVAIEHGNEKRIDELTPFKNEKYGGGRADNYLEFLVKTLKPKIDSTYRTKPEAKNTCIFGSSLGGLISFYAAIKYPEVFGKVGCFSPAFWINKQEITDLMEKTKKFDAKVYFMCGDKEDNGNVATEMKAINNLVNTKRCECKYLNKLFVVKNGEHNEKLWREQFAKAYLWLF